MCRIATERPSFRIDHPLTAYTNPSVFGLLVSPSSRQSVSGRGDADVRARQRPRLAFPRLGARAFLLRRLLALLHARRRRTSGADARADQRPPRAGLVRLGSRALLSARTHRAYG